MKQIQPTTDFVVPKLIMPTDALAPSRKVKRGTIKFVTRPRINGWYSVVGKREGEGPIGKYFDEVLKDCRCKEKTYEKAENHMFLNAIDGALKCANLQEQDLDVLLAGDLLNQIVSSSYAARCFDTHFLGLYNACSTLVEALTIGAMFVDAGFCDNVACCTGSHFATAERQYRGPLELGCQRAPYSQWTVTGAGCSIVGRGDAGVSLTCATIGKVVDFGVLDVTNMGAAMAPAAMETMLAHFEATSTTPADYDLVVTGDLGKLGSDILRELMREKGMELGRYMDCGHLIYDLNQKVCQGGSGAGCSASVLNGYFIKKMLEGKYKKILFLATGALMSLTSSQQGETIPCIAHAIVLES